MTQAEIIRWAVSAIKTKRIAFWNGYNDLKETNKDAADKLLEEMRNLNEKQQELEKMLEEEEK